MGLGWFGISIDLRLEHRRNVRKPLMRILLGRLCGLDWCRLGVGCRGFGGRCRRLLSCLASRRRRCARVRRELLELRCMARLLRSIFEEKEKWQNPF